MSAPPVLTELKLSAEMKDAINKAFEIQKPIVVAYVDENNAPQISYRGSTQSSAATMGISFRLSTSGVAMAPL